MTAISPSCSVKYRLFLLLMVIYLHLDVWYHRRVESISWKICTPAPWAVYSGTSIDGTRSDWFNISTSVRQGCGIAHNLFAEPVYWVMERTVHRRYAGKWVFHWSRRWCGCFSGTVGDPHSVSRNCARWSMPVGSRNKLGQDQDPRLYIPQHYEPYVSTCSWTHSRSGGIVQLSQLPNSFYGRKRRWNPQENRDCTRMHESPAARIYGAPAFHYQLG